MPEAPPPAIPPRQVEDVDESGDGAFRIGHLSLFGLIVFSMLPFPILACVVCWGTGILERWDEASIPFLGLLLIPVAVIKATLDPGSAILVALGVIMWLGLALPGMFMGRLIRRRSQLAVVLGIMAAISLMQAGVGVLMILGKSV